MTAIRQAETEADLEQYVRVWNALTPDEPASAAQQRERRERDPRRLYLLADLDGDVAGCGFAGASDSPGRGFLQPRVLPAARRRGIGTAVLRALVDHLAALDFDFVSSHVDGRDEGSLAFAGRFGFEEVDRQVEQVKTLDGEQTVPLPLPEGVRLVTIADDPDLLRAAHELAVEGYADMATAFAVTITLDDWLRDEATVPEGSFVALAGDEIVGYSGLCDRPEPGTAEDGLTVVRRAWRRRGVARAIKRAKLAWAAANGVVEIVTWTQRGNEGMRRLNEQLGYVYRSVSITVRAPIDRIAL
jgi:mycothiol synthase